MKRLMTRAEFLTVRGLDEVEAVRLLIASSKVHAGLVEIHSLSGGTQVVFLNAATREQPAHIAMALSLEFGVARVMFTALNVSPAEMTPITPAAGEAHEMLTATLVSARESWPAARVPVPSVLEEMRLRLMARRSGRPAVESLPGERRGIC